MQNKEQTTSYVELSSQTYGLFVEAASSYNKRALEYAKSFWEITSRPYASTAVETTVRENFDRANQLVSLTVHELQTTGQHSAEFGEKLASHGAKVQESVTNSIKGLVDTNLSNVHFVRDSLTKSFDEVAKKIEDVQARTTTSAGVN